MSIKFREGITSLTLAFVAVTGAGAPALAATNEEPVTHDGVTVVDEPDTSDLHDVWTDYTVLGVPVVGLVQSLAQVASRLLPTR